MKVVNRIAFVLTVAGLAATPAFGQTTEDQTTVVGLNLLGPVVGLYSGSFEQAIDDDLSIFVRPVYFNPKIGVFDALASHHCSPQRKEDCIEREDWDLWVLSVAAGANYFLDSLSPTGVFAGAWLQPGYGWSSFKGTALDPTGERKQVEVPTVILGAGAHVGYRLIWGPVAVTPRVGISYQLALSPVAGFHTVMKNLVDSVNTGLRFPWGIDIGIAF
jgi:hypothetical protein